MGNARFSDNFRRDAVHALSGSGLLANHEKEITVWGYLVKEVSQRLAGEWHIHREGTSPEMPNEVWVYSIPCRAADNAVAESSLNLLKRVGIGAGIQNQRSRSTRCVRLH